MPKKYIQKTRMYALTTFFMSIWLFQSLYGSYKSGDLFAWYTLIFSLCLLIVIGYCGYNAFKGFSQERKDKRKKKKK